MRALLMLAALTLAASLCAQTADLREQERRARSRIAAGKPAEAALLYRQIVEGAPDIPALRVNFAVALLAAGDYAEAAAQCRQAKRLDPSIAGADALLGAAFFLSERYEESLQPLQAALAARPSDANSRLRLAEALLALGRHAEALPHYEQLLPGATDARILQGAATACLTASSPLCVQARGQLEALGETPALFAYRAESLEGAGRFLEAAAQWRQAREAAPDEPRYRSAHARALYRAGDFAAALEALGPEPSAARDQGVAGHCLLMLARPAEALPRLQAAVNATPADAALQGALGQALLELGRPEDAIPHVEIGAVDAAGYYRLARAYRLAGRTDKANQALEAYRRYKP